MLLLYITTELASPRVSLAWTWMITKVFDVYFSNLRLSAGLNPRIHMDLTRTPQEAPLRLKTVQQTREQEARPTGREEMTGF